MTVPSLFALAEGQMVVVRSTITDFTVIPLFRQENGKNFETLMDRVNISPLLKFVFYMPASPSCFTLIP